MDSNKTGYGLKNEPILLVRDSNGSLLSGNSGDISKVATTPDFVEKIVQTGGEVIAGSPQEAIQFIADQVAEYKDLIKKANIQVQ